MTGDYALGIVAWHCRPRLGTRGTIPTIVPRDSDICHYRRALSPKLCRVPNSFLFRVRKLPILQGTLNNDFPPNIPPFTRYRNFRVATTYRNYGKLVIKTGLEPLEFDSVAITEKKTATAVKKNMRQQLHRWPTATDDHKIRDNNIWKLLECPAQCKEQPVAIPT
ncbi:hypothetical protein L6452_00805 [Arctium lappa]|uniref:Uncharacterized protein n=1 Tax=Arctium lappa TaxID=4217 RepID=A0ACB9FEY9_ARCLA|nr:hypothetical protein L6452_00805 [Arctium lappa]